MLNKSKRRLIASFRLPTTKWRMVVRFVSVAVWLFWMADALYWRHQPSPWYLIGLIGSFISGDRSVRFYEDGVVIPKNAGEVLLTREQVLTLKLVGHRLVVTGPDADWNGPYSGGTFLMCESDLPKLREVLARFTEARTLNSRG